MNTKVNETTPLTHENAADHSEGGSGVKLYRMRWVVLLQFCFIFTGNALQWVTFSLVVDQSKSDYGMTTAQVNFLATDYEVVYALLAVGAMIAFDRIGLRGTLRLASLINLAGAALRIISAILWQTYLPVILSQTLFSAAMTFLLAAPPMVSARWFGESERTLATTIGSMSNSLGLALGQLIPALVVTPDHHAKRDWLLLFCVISAPFALDAFLIFFVVPAKPLTPPSASESLKEDEKNDTRAGPVIRASPLPPVLNRIVAKITPRGGDSGSDHGGSDDGSQDDGRSGSASRRRSTRASSAVMEVAEHLSAPQQLKRIFHIPAFVLLFVTAGIFFGCQWSVISLMTQILQPFGFAESTVGWMGFSGTTIGAFISLFMGAWIDKRRVYREPLFLALAIFSLTFWGIALVLFFECPYAIPIVFTLYVLSGMAQACCVPLVLEMTVELTYPYEETLGTTAVMWAGNTFCVPLMYIVPAIIGTNPTKSSGLSAINAVALVSAIAAILVGVSKPIYKRLEYEQSLVAESAAADDNATP